MQTKVAALMETLNSPRTLAALALALVIVGNAVGNILLKLGATAAKVRPPFLGILNWQTIAGIACFGIGLLGYAWALRQFDLHSAQIVVSLQYVLAILLAGWILKEHIGTMQWFGIALIAIGLSLCTR